MKIKHYIHRRNNKYYFRARFLLELVKFIGRKELSRSLITDSYQEEVQKCPHVRDFALGFRALHLDCIIIMNYYANK